MSHVFWGNMILPPPLLEVRLEMWFGRIPPLSISRDYMLLGMWSICTGFFSHLSIVRRIGKGIPVAQPVRMRRSVDNWRQSFLIIAWMQILNTLKLRTGIETPLISGHIIIYEQKNIALQLGLPYLLIKSVNSFKAFRLLLQTFKCLIVTISAVGCLLLDLGLPDRPPVALVRTRSSIHVDSESYACRSTFSVQELFSLNRSSVLSLVIFSFLYWHFNELFRLATSILFNLATLFALSFYFASSIIFNATESVIIVLATICLVFCATLNCNYKVAIDSRLFSPNINYNCCQFIIIMSNGIAYNVFK